MSLRAAQKSRADYVSIVVDSFEELKNEQSPSDRAA
jgi:hypothetical protein